jgi:cytochrome c-type biogenesis protein CcmE
VKNIRDAGKRKYIISMQLCVLAEQELLVLYLVQQWIVLYIVPGTE